MTTPKICFILGTRPEIIKMYSAIKYCHKKKIQYFLIHTNQHYNSNMDAVFFEELKLELPKYNLNVGSGSHASMTAKMLIGIEEALLTEQPTVVVVQGDTNSTMAGALVAAKMDIKVAHIEAGLRSYDRTMPEETNRIMVDHISDFLFPPTQKQYDIILQEGIDTTKVHLVGNTVVDAVLECKNLVKNKTQLLQDLKLGTVFDDKNNQSKNQSEITSDTTTPQNNSITKNTLSDDLFGDNEASKTFNSTAKSTNGNLVKIQNSNIEAEDIFADSELLEIEIQKQTQNTTDQSLQNQTHTNLSNANASKLGTSNYFLLTCHRPSNTEVANNFEAILSAVQALCLQQRCKCIFPIHPRLKAKHELLASFSEIIVIDPVGFLDSIALQIHSDMIFTDSGGIQEESCILKCKTVILRTNTERPESVEVGGAILLEQLTKKDIIQKFEQLTQKRVEWSNPFGDGKSGQKIIDICIK